MFHQPMEYDPQLLDKLATGEIASREDQLRRELGFDDSDSDEETNEMVQQLRQELQSKQKEVRSLSDQLIYAQQISHEAETHVKQLQQTVKSTKQFLVKEYEVGAWVFGNFDVWEYYV